MTTYVRTLNDINQNDIAAVGGKNAALGEMISHLTRLGVNVPSGFVTTIAAYQLFIEHNGLSTLIQQTLDSMKVNDITSIQHVGKTIRDAILSSEFPTEVEQSVRQAYEQYTQQQNNLCFAVRSSATHEDLPEASFAGLQDSFLNVEGLNAILTAIKAVFASAYSDRALSYRAELNLHTTPTLMSATIQQMVRAENAVSGVMFTLDPETGFDGVILVNAAYGLGELVVQGAINPDEFYLSKQNLSTNKPAVLQRNMGSKHKKMVYGHEGQHLGSTQVIDVDKADRQLFCVDDETLTELGKTALLIEQHYKMPMDVEWAKDAIDGKLYIVQARPETVKSRKSKGSMERYLLKQKGKVLLEGRSIGQRIAAGKIRMVHSIKELDKVQQGDILVTDMTDPDWESVMKITSAIITNRGGRTCHAAIIARELGIPAIVGTGNATETLEDQSLVTVSCAEGDTGYVYEGALDFEVQKNSLNNMPELPVMMMMNVGNPDRAYDYALLPNQGVGLARLEFIINRMIGVHPKALINFDKLPRETQTAIMARSAGYRSPVEFYVEKLVEGIATLGTAFAGKPVMVRLSDFKSNDYANLLGGKLYEPNEDNPAIGFRGASRYIADNFRDCFELECRAIRKVREELGMPHIHITLPFVRTVAEAKRVIDLLAANGLKREDSGLKIFMMCEVPSNALLAEQFLQYFDGFTIGTNDLTQLTLGLDRDSGIISHLFDERDEAVKALISMAIKQCKALGKEVHLSGQGAANHPEFAAWLMQQGVESLSLNPDTVLDTWFMLSNLQR